MLSYELAMSLGFVTLPVLVALNEKKIVHYNLLSTVSCLRYGLYRLKSRGNLSYL